MKRIVSIILALTLICCMIPTAFAASSEATEAADALNALGLFNGTGTDANGKPIYDLDRTPTRAEAVTMLVRLLGKESEAKAGTWTTPFTDVQDWAKPYVGYAYANKLTSGTSATTFGGSSIMTATQYITLVLRALGYESGTDFQWDKAWELSDKTGMTDGRYNASTTKFTRGDVAQISKTALAVCEKGSDITLAGRLLENGAIDMGAALLAGIAPGTETVKITLTANDQDFYFMDFQALAAQIPNARYGCLAVLPKSTSPKSLDELISASDHMSSLLCNETPGRYNFNFGSHALEQMSPVMLMFSDKNTLCAYMIGRPTRLDEDHLQPEFVLCDYFFAELTENVRAEYEAVALSRIDMATEKTPQMVSFLPYSGSSDLDYVENNLDSIVCNMWLQHRSLIKYDLPLFGYNILPISEYDTFNESTFENWKTYMFGCTMATTYLILDANNEPIGYTVESCDLPSK